MFLCSFVCTCISHLVLVIDVPVRQLTGDEFVETDAEGVGVGLERVGVLFFHANHLRRLQVR